MGWNGLILGLSLVAWFGLLAVAVFVGIPLVRYILKRADTRDGDASLGQVEVLRGGTWIGTLERLIVFVAVSIGQFTIIAVVVAVKGLGRFPELRQHPAASEKFVIGTLASLAWAGILGGVTWLLPVL